MNRDSDELEEILEEIAMKLEAAFQEQADTYEGIISTYKEIIKEKDELIK